jgi:hypothetical protein
VYHVTQLKSGIKDYLAEYLPQALVEADAEAADGITTEPPKTIWTTAKQDLEAFPSVEIIVTDSRAQLDTTAQVMRHRLVVGFTIVGDDEVTLQTQVERYMWVLRRVLRDTQLNPPHGSAALDTGGEQYTPMIQRPPGFEAVFVTGGFIEVIAQTVE